MPEKSQDTSDLQSWLSALKALYERSYGYPYLNRTIQAFCLVLRGLRYSCDNADRKIGKWIGVANLNLARKIKLTFDPGDGRLFRVI
jgi:hypothetical protein